MLGKLRIRFNQFLEEAREHSALEAMRKAISAYFHSGRIVVPCYNDFSALKEAGKVGDTAALEFVVVGKENAESVYCRNKLCSRRLKGTYNTGFGYYAYAVLCDGAIVADIWCATPRHVKFQPIHRDLQWLGIQCGENDAYMFDMYVTPDARGKIVTNFLLSNALQHLKEAGFSRAYGFYEKDNLPALWIHRLFGYIEMQKRRVSKILFFSRSEPVPSPSPAGKE